MSKILGQTVGGRFRILETLGAGGIGEVYLAEHKELRSPFAVKVLRRELAGDEEVVGRFRREALAASRLQHRNIVYITDFGQLDDGRFYLVMEHLAGRSLDGVLAERGRLDMARALKIGIQVADAMLCAHAHGVIHRDLKPDNIMLVSTPGRQDYVKLIDFGLAKLLDQASKLTADGAVFGTPHNMSPEQTQGLPVDHRTDIYSFGTVLYECLTDRTPFEANDVYQLLVAHREKQARPPSAHLSAEEILPELDAVVMRCLQKKPEDRYQGFGELLIDLRACQKALERKTGQRETDDFLVPQVSTTDDWEPPTKMSAGSAVPGSADSGLVDPVGPQAGSPGRRRSSQSETQRVTRQASAERGGSSIADLDACLGDLTEPDDEPGPASGSAAGPTSGPAASSPSTPRPQRPGSEDLWNAATEWGGPRLADPSSSADERKSVGAEVGGGSDFVADPTRRGDSVLYACRMETERRRSEEGETVSAPWWLDGQAVKLVQEIADELRDRRLSPPELLQVLVSIYDLDEQILELGSRMALEEDRFRELEDSYRERSGRLRRAIVELNLEKALLKDQGVHTANDASRLQDVGFQVGELERRLHELEVEEERQLGGCEQNVSSWRKSVCKLQGELVGCYERLMKIIQASRPQVEDLALLDRYKFLDELLARLAEAREVR